MSADEKRAAVIKAIRQFPGRSDRAIAQMTGTSHPFVGKIRAELDALPVEKVETKPLKVETETPVPPAGIKRIVRENVVRPNCRPLVFSHEPPAMLTMKSIWRQLEDPDREAFKEWASTCPPKTEPRQTVLQKIDSF